MSVTDEEIDALRLESPGIDAPTSTPTVDDELDQLRGEFEFEQDARVKQLFETSLSGNPDRKAGVLKLAKETRAPTDVIEADFDNIRTSWEASKFDARKWRQENPRLAQMMLERPELGELVMHDPGLSTLQKLWNAGIDALGWLDEKTDSLRVEGEDTPEEKSQRAENREAATAVSKPTLHRNDEKAEALRGAGTFDRLAVLPIARYQESAKQMDIAKLQFQLMRAKALGDESGQNADTYALEKRILDLKRDSAPRDFGENEFERVLSDVANATASQMAVYEEAGLFGAVGAAGGGLLGYAVARGPGARTGAARGARLLGKAGAAYGSLQLEAGSMYGELADAQTDAGKPLTNLEATGGALLYGTLSAAVEMGSLDVQLGPLVNRAKSGELKQLLTNNSHFRTLVARAARQWLKSSAAEGGEEAAQEALQQAVEYFTKSASQGEFQVGQEALGAIDPSRVIVAGEAGFKGSAFGLGGAQATVGFVMEKVELDRAHLAAKQIEALANLDSPTAKAAPEAVAKMVEAATAENGQPVTHVYVDAQAFTRLFQEQKQDPAQAATELLGENGPAALQEAAATGGRLEIPVAQYLDKWGNTDIAKALVGDTSASRSQPTLNEMAQRQKDVEAEAHAIATEHQKANPEQASLIDERMDELEKQLTATKTHNKQQARAAVAPIRAFLHTQVHRFGVEPAKLFGDVRISAKTGDGQTPLEAVAAQGTAPEQQAGPPPLPGGDVSFDFGANASEGQAEEESSPDQVEEAKALIGRMKDPAKKAMAQAWLEYTQGATDKRPQVTPKLERELAKYGVVDPEGYSYDESGRSMERTLPGRRVFGKEPDSLREARQLRGEGHLPWWMRYQQAAFAEPAIASKLLSERARKLGPEERARDLFVDPVTGLLQERAFRRHGPLAIITTPDIKAINDNPEGGHDTANALLRHIGRAVAEIDPEAARGGTNFILHMKDEASLDSALEKIRAALPPGVIVEGAFGYNLKKTFQKLDQQTAAKRAAGDIPSRGETGIDLTKLEELEQSLAAEPVETALRPDLVEQAGKLSPEQFFNEAYQDKEVPGILSATGWRNIPRKRWVASLDLRGLKAVNELAGKEFGNRLLERFGNTLQSLDGSDFDVAHLSGDEYAAQHDNRAELEAFLADLEADLQREGLRVTLVVNGAPRELNVTTRFRSGIGEGSYGAADRNLNAAKAKEPESERNYNPFGTGRPSKATGRQADVGSLGKLGNRRNLRGAPAQGYVDQVKRAKRLFQERNLLVQHNLTEANLLHADELGGLAAPSIAVSRVEHPLEGFGEITLLGRPDLVDPKLGTPTFEADIYSPRHPKAMFRLVPKELNRIHKWLSPFAKKAGSYLGDLEDKLERDESRDVVRNPRIRPSLELAYLEEKGVSVAVPMQQARLSHTFLEMPAMADFFKGHGAKQFQTGDGYHQALTAAVRQAADQLGAKVGDVDLAKDMLEDLLDEKGLVFLGKADSFVRDSSKIGQQEVDTYAFEDALKAKVDDFGRKDFEKWATQKLKPAQGERFIRKVSESGNTRRIPYTLENVLKEVTKKVRQGEDFNYGLGTARAAGAKKFRSLEQIQKARNKIVSNDQFRALKEEMDKRFGRLADELQSYHSHPGGFRVLEGLATAIGESYQRGRWLSKELERSGFDGVPRELQSKVAEFATDLLAMPTEYFEAKPQRAVALSEFSLAVVPEGTSDEALQVLRKYGLQVKTYVKGDEKARATVIAEAATTSNILFQGDEAEARGYTDIIRDGIDRIFDIALNPSADFSTFLHESGHVFLYLFKDLAEREDAPEQVRADYQTALRWLGADSGGNLQTEHHEKWARGFEAYLMEGKAPSPALAKAFERFKLWLKKIYRTLVSLDVEMNDDIRGVFDRLLATDEEIARTKAAMGLQPMFRSPDEAGMTPQQWEGYLEAQEQASAHAARATELRVLKDRLRELEKWWKEELSTLKEQAEQEYEDLPARRAQRFLRGQEVGPDGKVTKMTAVTKLDKAAVVEALGPERAKTFVTEKDGIHPDEIADLFGFETGLDMLDAVYKLSPKEKWVTAEARDRMLDRHPDILEERQQLREHVAKGLNGDYTAKWLLDEWQALRRKTGQGPAPVDAVKRAAELLVERKAIGRLDAGGMLRQERSAADRAMKAATKGDYAQAAIFKQQQLLNMYMHRALLDARDEREAFLDLASRLSKNEARARLGKASPLYRGGSDMLLEAFGLKEKRDGEPRPSIGEVVQQLMADNATVVFDESTIVRLVSEQKAWKDLSVAEMREVMGALKNLQTTARNVLTVLVDGKREDREEVIGKMLAETKVLVSKGKLKHRGPVVPRAQQTKFERLLGWANAYVGEQRRPEAMIRLMGAEDILGPDTELTMWHKAIIQPMQDAKAKEADLLNKTVAPIIKVMDKLSEMKGANKRINGRELFPQHQTMAGTDLEPPRTVLELMMLVLHAGNESNLQRLTEGRNITLDQIRRAIDTHLSKEHLDVIQEIWDANDSLWPEAAALEERDSGLRPRKIKPTPLATRHGVLRGGYMPAAYVAEVERAGKKQDADGLMDPAYVRPGTSRGHLKARVQNFAGALAIDPSTITRHIVQVAHDIAYREAVKSVASIVMSERIFGAVRDYLGIGYAETLYPWVKDVAQMRGVNDGERAKALAKPIRMLKANTVVAALGYSLPHAFEDIVSNLPAAIARTDLKTTYLSAAIARLARSPVEAVEFADSKSGVLRERRGQLQRELDQKLAHFTEPKWLKRLGFVKDHAFVFMEWSDKYTSTPIWLGAYQQGLDAGKSDIDAVHFADAVVGRILPSHSKVDVPAIMRDKGAIGALLMFHGWLSVHFNSVADLLTAFGRADTVVGRTKIGGRMLAYLAIVGPLAALARAQGPEDGEEPEEWLLRKTLLGALAGDVMGKELASAVESKLLGKQSNARTPSYVTAAMTFFENASKTAKDYAGDGELDDGRLLRLLRSVGPMTGLPAGGPARTITYPGDAANAVRNVVTRVEDRN